MSPRTCRIFVWTCAVVGVVLAAAAGATTIGSRGGATETVLSFVVEPPPESAPQASWVPRRIELVWERSTGFRVRVDGATLGRAELAQVFEAPGVRLAVLESGAGALLSSLPPTTSLLLALSGLLALAVYGRPRPPS